MCMSVPTASHHSKVLGYMRTLPFCPPMGDIHPMVPQCKHANARRIVFTSRSTTEPTPRVFASGTASGWLCGSSLMTRPHNRSSPYLSLLPCGKACERIGSFLRARAPWEPAEVPGLLRPISSRWPKVTELVALAWRCLSACFRGVQ